MAIMSARVGWLGVDLHGSRADRGCPVVGRPSAPPLACTSSMISSLLFVRTYNRFYPISLSFPVSLFPPFT